MTKQPLSLLGWAVGKRGAGALPVRLGARAGEGAKRRGREADSGEMNDSGLPIADFGQEVRRSVLHMTGFRFSKWQRELIVFPS